MLEDISYIIHIMLGLGDNYNCLKSSWVQLDIMNVYNVRLGHIVDMDCTWRLGLWFMLEDI